MKGADRSRSGPARHRSRTTFPQVRREARRARAAGSCSKGKDEVVLRAAYAFEQDRGRI